MQEKQDGKIVEDVFEIWQVSMELGTRPSIDICVASFVTNNGGTIMFLWNHKSSQLSESGDNEYQATTRSGLKNIFGA